LKLIAQNRGSIIHVIRESFTNWNGKKGSGLGLELIAPAPGTAPGVGGD